MNRFDLSMRQLAMHKAWPDFILKLIRSGGIFTPTAGAEQTLQFFREGQRSLGLDIIRWSADARGLSFEQMLGLILTSEPIPEETQSDRADQPDDRIDRD